MYSEIDLNLLYLSAVRVAHRIDSGMLSEVWMMLEIQLNVDILLFVKFHKLGLEFSMQVVFDSVDWTVLLRQFP